MKYLVIFILISLMLLSIGCASRGTSAPNNPSDGNNLNSSEEISEILEIPKWRVHLKNDLI